MTRVKEFVEVVGVGRRVNHIDSQVNKWIIEQEKKAHAGKKLDIQDIKYHTQYRKGEDDMVHSVLIIWDWKDKSWNHRKRLDADKLAKDLYDEFRGISFGGKTPEDYIKKEPKRHWYSTPDESWGEGKPWRRKGR